MISAAAIAVGAAGVVFALPATGSTDKYCKFIFDDPPPDCTFIERDIAGQAKPIPALQFHFVSFTGAWTARGTATATYPAQPERDWQYTFTVKSPHVALRPVPRARRLIQLATSTTDPRYRRKPGSRSRPTPPPLSGWVTGTVTRSEEWTNVPEVSGEPHTGTCAESVHWGQTAGVGLSEFVLLPRGRVKVEVDFGAPGKQCVTRHVHYTSAGEPPSAAYSFWLFRTIPVRKLQRKVVTVVWAGTRHETYQDAESDHSIDYAWTWKYAVKLVLRKAPR
jgi:hypothetical protein